MVEVQDQPQPVLEEIVITIHFVDGDMFKQPFPIDFADRVQNFMDWFRNPGRNRTWAWHVIQSSQIHMFRHEHIMAVDIDGYIEPAGRPSRWYELILDRFRMWWC